MMMLDHKTDANRELPPQLNRAQRRAIAKHQRSAPAGAPIITERQSRSDATPAKTERAKRIRARRRTIRSAKVATRHAA